VGWAEYPRAHNATTTTSAHLASDCFFSPVVENFFIYIFLIHFAKIYDRFNLSVLTTNRRGARRPPWATAADP
jgi:hypothetical protein